MRPLIAILLVAALLLSGCASKGKDDDKDDDGTSTGTGTASQSGSKSGTGTSKPGTTSGSQTGSPNPSNHAPVGTIAAVVNGTSVQFALTGTDRDNDTLSWTLSFGDASADQDGTTLPANVTHTFAVGNYTAHYNLTDGKATASYNVSVNVTAAPSGGGLTFSGGVDNFCAMCTESVGIPDIVAGPGPLNSVSWLSGEQGIDAVWVEIPASLIGHAFSASTTGADIALAFADDCAPDAAILVLVDGPSNPEVGAVPAGAACVVMWEYFAYDPTGEPSMPGGQTLAIAIA